MTCINPTCRSRTHNIQASSTTVRENSCGNSSIPLQTGLDDTSVSLDESWEKNISNDDCDSTISAPTTPTAQHNLIVFDYDDTLFPTTFLSQRGYRLDGPTASLEIQSILEDYSAVVETTLTEAEKHGQVVILTNAESGWISLTSQKFMPGLARLLDRYPAISARSTYEPLGVMGPFNWKLKAFEALLSDYSAAMRTVAIRNVVSLGDSLHERDAAQQASANFDKCFCKCIKLIERPDIGELFRQHQLIQDCLLQVVTHNGTLDLCVQNQEEVVSTFS